MKIIISLISLVFMAQFAHAQSISQTANGSIRAIVDETNEFHTFEYPNYNDIEFLALTGEEQQTLSVPEREALRKRRADAVCQLMGKGPSRGSSISVTARESNDWQEHVRLWTIDSDQQMNAFIFETILTVQYRDYHTRSFTILICTDNRRSKK